MNIDDVLNEVAENANTYTPLGPADERIVDERFVLWMGRGDEPGWNVAQRFRLTADEVEPLRDEIHALLRARGRTPHRSVLWVSPKLGAGSHVLRLRSLGGGPVELDAVAPSP